MSLCSCSMEAIFFWPRSISVSMSSLLMLDSELRNTASAPNFTAWSMSSLVSFFWFSCRRPDCTTMASSFNFWVARSTTFSSMLFSVTRRYTCTAFFCPIRCARSWACKSACGFQSLSKSTTVSAVCKLIPKPPARVDSKNTNLVLFSALNESIRSERSSYEVLPSMRQYW